VKEGRCGIDQLYTQVLQHVSLNVGVDDAVFYSNFRSVVGAVVLLFNPLSVAALSELLGISDVSIALRSLHSLLVIPPDQSGKLPVRVLHKSFPDFLTDPLRCTDKQFYVDPSVGHREIVLSCLRLMKERLRKNICQLDDFVCLDEVKDLPALKKAHIGDPLEYACCFWASHLVKTSSIADEEVSIAIDEFFTTSFLFWVEVLSLVRNLDIGVHALNDIDQWYNLVSLT
jgi:hypothetical protein